MRVQVFWRSSSPARKNIPQKVIRKECIEYVEIVSFFSECIDRFRCANEIFPHIFFPFNHCYPISLRFGKVVACFSSLYLELTSHEIIGDIRNEYLSVYRHSLSQWFLIRLSCNMQIMLYERQREGRDFPWKRQRSYVIYSVLMQR